MPESIKDILDGYLSRSGVCDMATGDAASVLEFDAGEDIGNLSSKIFVHAVEERISYDLAQRLYFTCEETLAFYSAWLDNLASNPEACQEMDNFDEIRLAACALAFVLLCKSCRVAGLDRAFGMVLVCKIICSGDFARSDLQLWEQMFENGYRYD